MGGIPARYVRRARSADRETTFGLRGAGKRPTLHPFAVIRNAGSVAVCAALAAAAAACGAQDERSPASAVAAATAGEAAPGRLSARPRGRVAARAPRGRRKLPHGAELYVPRGYEPGRPSALVLTLHGAHGDPGNGFGQLLPLADDAGLILLAPKSARATWDVAYGGFGADVAAIDDLLRRVFARYAVDPNRVFVSGFSDGASYAVSLGLVNGDLFRAVAAFSPGFATGEPSRRKPRVFVSHGTRDTVLPLERTSRPLVRALRGGGYDVVFRRFDGPHTVPPPIAREAVAWLLRRPTPR